MGSEIGISLLLVGIVLSLNFFERKLNKKLFFLVKFLSLAIISVIYMFGLTPSTSTYRAFLIFIGIYLVGSVGVNYIISKYTSNYSKTNNISEFKNKNLNTRITIYSLALLFSIVNFFYNKWEDINNVFTTVIIIDVVLDLILTKLIEEY